MRRALPLLAVISLIVALITTAVSLTLKERNSTISAQKDAIKRLSEIQQQLKKDNKTLLKERDKTEEDYGDLSDRYFRLEKSLSSRGVKREKKFFKEHSSVATKGSSGQISYYRYKQGVAAHRWLAKGTKVTVTNQVSGKSIVVTIGDRGPFISGRILDLDERDFIKLAPLKAGVFYGRISW